MLDEYHARHAAHMTERRYADEYRLENNCVRLLQAVQNGGNLADSKTVLVKLFDLGYVKRGTYSLLKQFINGFIEK